MLVFGLISRLSWSPVAREPYFVPAGQEVLRIWVIPVLVLLLLLWIVKMLTGIDFNLPKRKSTE